jgi:transposase
MPVPYSVDLRERVMRALADGASITEAARRFSVSRDAITDWRDHLAATGSVTPRPATGGHPRRLTADDDTAIAAHIDAHPDRTIAELCAWWAETHGIQIPYTTMWRAVARLDRPLKKRA